MKKSTPDLDSIAQALTEARGKDPKSLQWDRLIAAIESHLKSKN